MKKKNNTKKKYAKSVHDALTSKDPIKELEPIILDLAGDDDLLRGSLYRIWNRRGL